jgi:hypothetical protein
MARRSDEVPVDFGLEFTADTSAVLAAASTTANAAVRLTWKVPPATTNFTATG